MATGGGDVIRIALGLGRSFEIHGVDLADLSAVNLSLRAPSVHLTGNVNIACLPFPDASFAGVTSQFGVEYADLATTAREAVRVLAFSGQGLFLLHHAGSEISRAARARLAAYHHVFSRSAAFATARAVFEFYVQSAPRNLAAQAEAEFRTATAELERRLSGDPAFGTARDIVSFLADLARSPKRYIAADALRRIEFAEEEIKAWVSRQQAQVEAALDREGIDGLMRFLTNAGASVRRREEIRDAQGRVLAWRCSFHK